MKCRRQAPRLRLSFAPSKKTADHRTETSYFPRDAPAHEELVAVVVQTEARRNPQSPAGWKIPSQSGRQIMRCVVQAKAVPVPQATIHLDPDDKILRTECAALRGSL